MIKRYFTSEQFARVQKDFRFLIKMIRNSYGEYDFSIREGYFNIYYKGNSLAKVLFKDGGRYFVEIHEKFVKDTRAYHGSGYYVNCRLAAPYYQFEVEAAHLHQFLQRKHLNEISSRIKAVNNGEEITFEQSLITDNLDNEKLIFIDRQVTDSGLKGKRLDLLALKQVEGNRYQFLVSEVKLGNNKELQSAVADQLNIYVSHIKTHFAGYKDCYEKQYVQKKVLGLIEKPALKNIEVVEPVDGIVIVGGYSGLAKSQIIELKKNYPDIKVKHFTYGI